MTQTHSLNKYSLEVYYVWSTQWYMKSFRLWSKVYRQLISYTWFFFFYRIRPYMWRISFLKSISLFIYPYIKIFNIRIWLMPFLKAWQAQNLQGRPPDCRYREELLFQVQRKSAGWIPCSFREFSLVLWKPDWMRPTRLTEGVLLYSKSSGFKY